MYQRTDLPNKLRIISQHVQDRESVSIGILAGTGGRFEDDHNKGAAHFLEHIVFKGSKKYSCDAIKQLIEGVGGSLNAYTTEEQTCYFAKIPARHLSRTFDVLADMVFFPNIAARDVLKERTVILEEIKMYRDLPQYYVLELLDEMMWPDHPLGKSLAGTAESVSAMSNKDLKAFHQKHYFADNVVVSACGSVNHKALVSLVRRKLSGIPSASPVVSLAASNFQEGPRVRLFRKETEQMHLALGMFGLDIENKDKYALALLNIILGGNMSSRLFNEVREKRGLAYSIGSSAKSLKDTGLFMIRAGVDNQKVVAATEVILKELRKIKRGGVSSGEFTRAKDFFLGQILLELEDTLENMLWAGSSTLLRDKVVTIQDIVRKVEKIRNDDIKRVAGEILREKNFNLAVIGPLTGTQERKLSGLLGAS